GRPGAVGLEDVTQVEIPRLGPGLPPGAGKRQEREGDTGNALARPRTSHLPHSCPTAARFARPGTPPVRLGAFAAEHGKFRRPCSRHSPKASARPSSAFKGLPSWTRRPSTRPSRT